MGKETNIAWTMHTFNPWSPLCVNLAMALPAEGESVRHYETQFWKICKLFDVVSDEVSASFIPAVLAGKFIVEKNIESPALVFAGESLISAFCEFPVFEGMTIGTALRSFSCYLAYECAGLKCMGFPDPVAFSSLRPLAHLPARFFTHL